MLALTSKPFKFSYIYAKCKALKSKTNDKDFFEDILESKNYADIYSHLEEKSYARFINEPTYTALLEGLNESFLYFYKSVTKGLSKKEIALFELFFFGRDILLEKKQKITKDKTLKQFNQLDKEFVKDLKERLNSLSIQNKRDLSKIFGSYFDTMNLYTIFRLKVFYNAQIHEILPFLYPFGLHIKRENIKRLLALNSLNEFNNELEPIYKESFEDLSSFRKVLYKKHYEVLNSVWLGFPFKISIIFSFLRMKEIEIQNIKSVIEGIKYKQPKSQIQRMLIGVGV